MKLTTSRICTLGFAFSVIALSGCGGGSSGGLASGGGGSLSTTASTLAGSSDAGSTDGALAVARFNNPVNVAVDIAENVYVSDFDNSRVRRISTGGNVSTLVNQANFVRPFGITVTPDGTLYVQTDGNDAGGLDSTTGTVWRVSLGGAGATVVARNLGRPRGIAALSNSELVIADLVQNDVRILNVNTGAVTKLAGLRGTAGFANGTGTTARFSRPYGPAVMLDGSILLADQSNHALRRITRAGVVTTFSGSGTAGFKDGSLSQALFNSPQDVDIDTRGFIYVSDNENHRIRRISPAGQVQTLAGDGTKGFRDGSGLTAEFYGQEGLAISKDNQKLVIADGNGGDGSNFNRVRILKVP